MINSFSQSICSFFSFDKTTSTLSTNEAMFNGEINNEQFFEETEEGTNDNVFANNSAEINEFIVEEGNTFSEKEEAVNAIEMHGRLFGYAVVIKSSKSTVRKHGVYERIVYACDRHGTVVLLKTTITNRNGNS